MEGMVVIIIAGSGDQFLKGIFEVLGNGEFFQKAKGGGGCLTDCQDRKENDR